ncbi:5-hydroxytryptamine receptor 7-like [Patiria miniata]|uniref:G-protein coupled receptors family 1 profile domain-containing protein n=1 Tax=Patiria miniata TaxID=46514 RepID=A0A914B9P9_PATMI|nr:5-hydroxytryptamine receptor 7-like [Patiria miniata]
MELEGQPENATPGSDGADLAGAQDIAIGVVLWLMSLFGAAGNCLTILAIITDRQLRSQSSSYLIVNLAVADMVVFVVIEPFLAFGTATRTWPFSTPFCASLGVLVNQHMVVSVCSMTAIAVNRYYSVVRRTSYHRVFTGPRTLIMCLATWLLGSALFLPLVASPFYANYSAYYGVCVVTSQDTKLGKAVITLIALNIVVNIVISSVCYLQIYREVRKSRLRVMPQVPLPGSDGQPSEDQPASNGSNQKNGVPARMAIAKQQIHRADVAISINLFIVFAVFCICWTPLAIFIFIQTSVSVQLIPGSVWQTAYKLVLFNSTLNIFIYAWKNRKLRSAYIKLLRCQRRT